MPFMVSALWFPYSFNFAFPKQNQNDNCIQYTDTGYPILTYIGIWRTRPYLDQPASLASPGLLPSGPYNDGFFAWKKRNHARIQRNMETIPESHRHGSSQRGKPSFTLCEGWVYSTWTLSTYLTSHNISWTCQAFLDFGWLLLPHIAE